MASRSRVSVTPVAPAVVVDSPANTSDSEIDSNNSSDGSGNEGNENTASNGDVGTDDGGGNSDEEFKIISMAATATATMRAATKDFAASDPVDQSEQLVDNLIPEETSGKLGTKIDGNGDAVRLPVGFIDEENVEWKDDKFGTVALGAQQHLNRKGRHALAVDAVAESAPAYTDTGMAVTQSNDADDAANADGAGNKNDGDEDDDAAMERELADFEGEIAVDLAAAEAEIDAGIGPEYSGAGSGVTGRVTSDNMEEARLDADMHFAEAEDAREEAVVKGMKATVDRLRRMLDDSGTGGTKGRKRRKESATPEARN
jgi:hypothetical protein